jgi:hypothetical protein
MQQSLFGVWKIGTAKEQAIVESELLFACALCSVRCKNLGALDVHRKIVHPTAVAQQRGVFESPVSLASQQILLKFKALEEVEEERFQVDHKEALQPAEDGESVKKKRRGGQPLRHRPSMRFKYKALMLIDKYLRDLTDAALLNDVPSPTLHEVFTILAENGVTTSHSNLYKWYMKRSKITARFVTEKKKRAKSVGSGRAPMLKAVEDTVKAFIYQQRQQHLRVSRSRAKELLKEKALELLPDVAAKFKFSKHYFRDAFRRMEIVVRRVSSSKSVTNEEAALFGRYFCKQLMSLRLIGSCEGVEDLKWLEDFVLDSVFGFFPPATIFAIDEVPFNFCEDGKTMAVAGQDAAVRTLRGTGKRAGTCVIACTAAGDLSKFVLIFKRKTPFGKKESEYYSKLPNVRVTYSESSYINEGLWMREVIDHQVFEPVQRAYGRDWVKRNYILLSDNHTSHRTDAVLKHCKDYNILPLFTPPNYTSHWSLVDDYVGTAARKLVYIKAEEYEQKYFEQNPKGDGALSAEKRRMLLAKWWNEGFDDLKDENLKKFRINAAKRVGLYVTAQTPADSSYLPRPVRFIRTPFEHFGETLYDDQHPDFAKVKKYELKKGIGAKTVSDEAHDEDGFSHEEEQVWKASEAEFREESDDAADEDDAGEIAEQHFVARAEARKAKGTTDKERDNALKQAERIGRETRRREKERKTVLKAEQEKLKK